MRRIRLVPLLVLFAYGCGDVPTPPPLAPPPATTPTTPPPVTRPPSTPPPPPASCDLPLASGPCNAAFRAYGFDAELGRCREFLWGGCGGNDNRFETFEACREFCGGAVEPPRACGGWAGETCASNEFCDFEGDGCDFADAQGICRPRPEGCARDYNPVCGCDAQTYGNLCNAHSAGIDAARNGMCEPPSGECSDQDRSSIITGGGRAFGFCAGACVFELSIVGSGPAQCDYAELVIRGHRPGAELTRHLGRLTPIGHASARQLARALIGRRLESVYGCPDCMDGGAGRLELRRGDERTGHLYEYANAPPELRAADGFVQRLVEALARCAATSEILPNGDCRARDDL